MPELDLDQLHSRAVLMSAAYLPAERCEAVVARQGYQFAGRFDEDGGYGAQAYVAYNDDEIVYCFAGSNDLVDWFRNLDARRTDFQGNRLFGRVHAGFHRTFNSIGWSMAAAIKNLLNYKPRRVVGIGHSHGSPPVAMMAHSYLAAHEPECWLFACPNFCDRWFRRQYNAAHGNRTYEIRAMPDVVPLFPMLFKSVGQQFVIAGRRLKYFPSWPVRLAHHVYAVWSWWRDIATAAEYVPPGIAAHFADNYVNKTRRLAA